MIFTQEAPFTWKWFQEGPASDQFGYLEMLIFEERGKPENPQKNISQQSKEPTTNLMQSSLRHPCSQNL